MAAAITTRIAQPTHSTTEKLGDQNTSFTIGALVNVESRTWPGINKPGGVGRVVSFDIHTCCVDVKYVLGGEEKGIDLEFVKLHTFEGDDTNNNEGCGRARRRRVAKEESSNTTTSNADRTITATKKEDATRNRTAGPTSTATKKKSKKALEDASSRANRVKGTCSTTNKASSSSSSSGSSNKKRKGQEEGTSVEGKGIKKVKKEIHVRRKKLNSEKMESKQKKTTSKAHTPPPAVTASLCKNTAPPASASASDGTTKAEKKSTSTIASMKDSSSSQRWSILPSPALVLQNVYKGMKEKGASFVQEIVGMKNSAPSSPESHSSLEIQMKEGRENEFDELFSNIMRQKMLDAIEFEDLVKELKLRSKDNPFTDLEVKQHLERLDSNNKVMLSSDSSSIYVL